MVVDEESRAGAGDLLHPLDLMVVVRPGDVGQSVGREVQTLQLAQLVTEIIVDPLYHLGARRVSIVKTWPGSDSLLLYSPSFI